MAFNVSSFRSNLTYSGARNTLFDVDIPYLGVTVPMRVRAASLPALTIGTIEVPYFGRKIKLPGDRSYEPWSVTVINDEDFGIKHALEEWSNAMQTFITNLRKTDAAPGTYKKDAFVRQYNKTGTAVIAQYRLNGVFPENISAIDVDWSATDQIEEFQVTFQYDWWERVSPGGQAI